MDDLLDFDRMFNVPPDRYGVWIREIAVLYKNRRHLGNELKTCFAAVHFRHFHLAYPRLANLLMDEWEWKNTEHSFNFANYLDQHYLEILLRHMKCCSINNKDRMAIYIQYAKQKRYRTLVLELFKDAVYIEDPEEYRQIPEECWEWIPIPGLDGVRLQDDDDDDQWWRGSKA